MNSVLEKLFKEQPQANQTMIDGFATKEVPKAPAYLDKVIISAMKSVNPRFTYHGYRKLSPKEEYQLKRNKPNHDLSGSDVLLYEYFFEYDGEKIPRKYLYMPFVRDAGIMEISGTKYAIVPVLTDTVISPSNNEVFVRLLKTKQFFRNTTRNIIKNGNSVIAEIVYSDGIASLDEKKQNLLGKVVTPVTLFIIGKYGFKESFKKYCNVEPIFTLSHEEAIKLKETHDIYQSNKIKPKSLKDIDYVPHDVHICIPKKQNSLLAEKMAGTIIYTFDVLPKTAANIAESLHAGLDIELSEWRVIIGRIAYKDFYIPSRGYDLIMDKYTLIESYLDSIVQEKLEESDIYVNDYYDLLVHMIDKYSEYLLKGKEYTNNIYNRYIDILYYLMFNFIYGVNTMIRDINNMSKNKQLTIQNINKLMTRRLSSKTIFGITKSGAMNICVTPIDSTTDSMFSKITGILELQERGKGVVKEPNNTFPSNTRKIVGTDLYLGSLYNLPKKYPTPKAKINVFAEFNEITNRIAPYPRIKRKVDYLDICLNGRVVDDFSAMEIVNNEEIDEVGDL